jgi:malate synthase
MNQKTVDSILTTEVKEFLNELHNRFDTRIETLLSKRQEFYKELHNNSSIRIADPRSETDKAKKDWKCSPCPDDILDRRVEITGPPERKMVINALNSGANVYMSDFEDSNCPTWENCIQGQINLRDAVEGTIEYTNQKNGKKYVLGNKPAVLFVRPRGLHLLEKNYLVGDNAIRASLFDFGTYFINNYKTLLENGSRPYFYLPKLEHAREAQLWNDIFCFAQDYVDINLGLIKATVLIETVPAVFQMGEILYELRLHSAGLNCGRWDYIFSYIKCFKHDKNFVLPDRSTVGMDSHFMKSYSQLLIDICHKRGVHAMGGMAAQIPIKSDLEANEAAMNKVRSDKLREVKEGHDGTWVAHPGLVPIAKEVFDAHMGTPNQINGKKTLTREVSVGDLITSPVGVCTEKMLRENINIMFLYMNSWINGNGCVPINNLMEDAATAEISRAQIWQWRHHEVTLDNRTVLNNAYLNQVLREELEKYHKLDNYVSTFDLTKEMCLSDNLDDFLTPKCYELIN